MLARSHPSGCSRSCTEHSSHVAEHACPCGLTSCGVFGRLVGDQVVTIYSDPPARGLVSRPVCASAPKIIFDQSVCTPKFIQSNTSFTAVQCQTAA